MKGKLGSQAAWLDDRVGELGTLREDGVAVPCGASTRAARRQEDIGAEL